MTARCSKDVKIKLTGNRAKDEELANAAAGLTKRPANYTWHHHQVLGRMQLVPTSMHQAARHTGGYAVNARSGGATSFGQAISNFLSSLFGNR
jgi:hypothetical protein